MYVCTQVVLLISDKPELLGTDNNINISLYVVQTKSIWAWVVRRSFYEG